MFFISDVLIDSLILEDFPNGDLTTETLGIGEQPGIIKFISRGHGVVSCTEEVSRILTKLNAVVDFSQDSGSTVVPGTLLGEAHGPASSLHAAWKICSNILEYYSGVATRTRAMVDTLKKHNVHTVIGSTRKMVPGTKALAVKAVINGGGTVHRLHLSESVLIFKQHLNFISDFDTIGKVLHEAKKHIPEKKIIIEVESPDLLDKILEFDIDGIQLDKCTPEDIHNAVLKIKNVKPQVIVLAAGGINHNNIEKYAYCEADVIVTSSMYYGSPFDIGVTINRV